MTSRFRLFAAALLAVSAIAPTGWAQNAMKPAIVYSTGGKFDKSFNEGVSAGAEKFKAETKIAIAEFEPSNETQFEQAHRRFAQRGYDPIVSREPCACSDRAIGSAGRGTRRELRRGSRSEPA